MIRKFHKEGLIHNGFIDIIFDKEFVEIIQNRYLNQIKDSEKKYKISNTGFKLNIQ